MIRDGKHRIVTAGIVAAAAILAAACTSETKGDTVDSSLTAAQAFEQIQANLAEALSTLPPGTSLSLSSQNPELGKLSPGTTAPCTLDNTAGAPPVYAYVGYWVVGVPEGRDTAYLQTIVDGLTARGWHIGTDSRPTDQFVTLGGPDRYGLQLSIAPRKTGSLSVQGNSPCFVGNSGSNDPTQPPVIEHP